MTRLLPTILCTMACLLLLAPRAGADEIDSLDSPQAERPIRLTLATTEPEVGERISATMTLPGREYANVVLSLPDDQREKIRLGDPRRTGANEFTFTVRPVQSGRHEIGPIEVTAFPTGGGEPVTLESAGFILNVPEIPGELSAELRDYTPPAELPFSYVWRNVVVAGAAAVALGSLGGLAALGIFLYRRRLERLSAVPPVPPVEIALEWIHHLKSMDVYRKEGVETHYTQLSMALRYYIEHQLKHRALEMSEDEVIELLKEGLSKEHKAESLIPVLQRASMAKYARHVLTEEIAKDDCGCAESFLETQRRWLAALQELRNRKEQETEGESGKAA